MYFIPSLWLVDLGDQLSTNKLKHLLNFPTEVIVAEYKNLLHMDTTS